MGIGVLPFVSKDLGVLVTLFMIFIFRVLYVLCKVSLRPFMYGR